MKILAAEPNNALLALAPVIREARSTFPERFAGKTDQQVINEIVAVVRGAEGKI